MDHIIPQTPCNSVSITTGYVISFDLYRRLLVDPGIFSCIGEPSWVLVIYALYPKLTRITCYPIPDATIYKLILDIEGIAPSILQFIAQTLSKAQIVHTTGVLEKTQGNYVEYYLNLPQSAPSIHSIVNSLKNHESIHQCNVELLRKRE